MNEKLTQIVEKISSYNIFTNLYPGIIFCHLFKYMTNVEIIGENWLENLIVFYFVGMLLSRIGSIFIEPALQQIKTIGKNEPLLLRAPYEHYVEASSEESSLLPVLSEVNNTYRTLLSTFICLFFCKAYFGIKNVLVVNKIMFLEIIDDWLLLLFLVFIFLCSYIKQTSYIRKNVETYMKRKKE